MRSGGQFGRGKCEGRDGSGGEGRGGPWRPAAKGVTGGEQRRRTAAGGTAGRRAAHGRNRPCCAVRWEEGAVGRASCVVAKVFFERQSRVSGLMRGLYR